jgi:hypothetical protein
MVVHTWVAVENQPAVNTIQLYGVAWKMLVRWTTEKAELQTLALD